MYRLCQVRLKSNLPGLPKKRRDGALLFPIRAKQTIMATSLTIGGLIGFSNFIAPELDGPKQPELVLGK